jgi:prepilin signal peptidase PulO-like enzyme (type II secretory pathway)
LYGATELTLGLVFTLNAWIWPLGLPLLIIQSLTGLSFYISLWDWHWQQIPVISLVLLSLLTILSSIFQQQHTVSPIVISGLLASLSFVWKLLGKPWILAKGDWILLILASSWISPWQLPTFLVLTGGLGILTALTYQRLYQTAFFPFAPAILIALWVTLIFGCNTRANIFQNTPTFSHTLNKIFQ